MIGSGSGLPCLDCRQVGRRRQSRSAAPTMPRHPREGPVTPPAGAGKVSTVDKLGPGACPAPGAPPDDRSDIASDRFVPPQRHPLDDPGLGAEVAHDGVLGGAVVPEADVARTPVVADGVLQV